MKKQKYFLYGSAYHPGRDLGEGEDWRAALREDIALMGQLHFNTVLIGMEGLGLPAPDGIRRLREVVSALTEAGIAPVPVLASTDLPDALYGYVRDCADIPFLLAGARDAAGRDAQLAAIRERCPGKEAAAWISTGELESPAALVRGDAEYLFCGNDQDWFFGDRAQTEMKAAYVRDRLRCMAREAYFLADIDPEAAVVSGRRRIKRAGIQAFDILHAAACGAGGFFYREWRQAERGAERDLGALVGHSGRTDTPGFREAERIGAAMEELKGRMGMTFHSGSALLVSGGADRELLLRYYRHMCRDSWGLDVIDEGADLSPYHLVVAPMMKRIADGTEEKIRQFVGAGGVWLSQLSPMSETETGESRRGDAPCGLTDVFGIRLSGRDELPEGEKIPLETVPDFHADCEAVDVCELPVPDGAEVLMRYKGQFYSGQPALTRKHYGKGFAYYLAAGCPEAMGGEILDKISGSRKKHAPLRDMDGLVLRWLEDGEAVYTICLNYSERERKIPLEYNKLDVLFGYDPLPAYGALVLKVRRQVCELLP